jgi:hypothetical protein
MLSRLKRTGLALGIIGAFIITPAVITSPAAAKPVPFHVIAPPAKHVVAAPKYVFRTDGNWSRSVDGVTIGWTNDHLWLISSYAAAAIGDASTAAGLGCGMIPGIGAAAAWSCRGMVATAAQLLFNGWPRFTNHGFSISYYPRQIWNESWSFSRY